MPLKLSLPIMPLFAAAFICGLGLPADAAIISGPVTNPDNNHTYYLLSQNNWTNSEAEAVTLGGHLATVNDAAENAWIVSTFANFGGTPRALWIGLNDAATEGTFVWSSGEPVVYTNWATGEPNNSLGIEDWAHIFPSTDSRFGTWNDAPDAATAFGFTFNGVVEVNQATATTPEPASMVAWSALSMLGAFCHFVRRRNSSVDGLCTDSGLCDES